MSEQPQKEQVFPKGIFFKKRRDEAPEFIRGHLSIKNAEAIAFLQAQNGEWTNIDLKKSKSTGQLYLAVNTWVKPQQAVAPQEPLPEIEYPANDLDQSPF